MESDNLSSTSISGATLSDASSEGSSSRYKWVVRFSKIKRFLTAVPIADLIASLVALAAIVTIGASIVGGAVKPETMRYLKISWIVALIFCPILLAILTCKTWLEYQKRKYDPSLIWTFQKEFDGLAEKRKEAAVVCFDFLRWNVDEIDEVNRWAAMEASERAKVEPVLDCFEDVGFYLSGDQFSDDVTHHNFFHWIRGWYSVLRPYIEYYQTIKGEKAAYIHVERLYRRTAEIERRYPKPQLLLTTEEDKLEFLREEGGEGDLNISGSFSVDSKRRGEVILVICAVNVGQTPICIRRVAALVSKSSASMPIGISEERATEFRKSLVSNEIVIDKSKEQVTELRAHGGQHTWEMAFRSRVDFEAHKKGSETLGRGYAMLTSGRKVFFAFALLQDSIWEQALGVPPN